MRVGLWVLLGALLGCGGAQDAADHDGGDGGPWDVGEEPEAGPDVGAAVDSGLTGDAGDRGHWCARQELPASVAMEDTSCLDFEDALPPEAEWSSDVAGRSALARMTGEGFDSSASLVTSVAQTGIFDTPAAATLDWISPEAAPVSRLSVVLAVKSTLSAGRATGSTPFDLVCMGLGLAGSGGIICLVVDVYVVDARGGYGLALAVLPPGGGEVKRCTLTGGLRPGVWSTIELGVSPGEGSSDAKIDGGLRKTCSAPLVTDGVARVTVGLTSGAFTYDWTVNFDDVMVTVQR